MATNYPTNELLGRPLSDRELECLRHVADGLSNAEIGTKIELSPNTVKSYVAHLLAKLGATSRAQAVNIGHERGLLKRPLV